MKRTIQHVMLGVLVVLFLGVTAGCSKPGSDAAGDSADVAAGREAELQLCDFAAGPEDAPVRVVAFYPGRHEDTLGGVKELLDAFPGQVRVEIVDWRTEEGLNKRDAAGLTCGGVVINGKNAFDIEIDGRSGKVLFVRGIDGEWTKDDLFAAVRQELAGQP